MRGFPQPRRETQPPVGNHSPLSPALSTSPSPLIWGFSVPSTIHTPYYSY